MLSHLVVFTTFTFLIEAVGSCRSGGRVVVSPSDQTRHRPTTIDERYSQSASNLTHDEQVQKPYLAEQVGNTETSRSPPHSDTSCKACASRLALSSPKKFEDEDDLRRQCSADYSLGHGLSSGLPNNNNSSKDDFVHRCSSCRNQCRTWHQLFSHLKSRQAINQDRLVQWCACLSGQCEAGPSPFLDEFQRHVVFSRQSRRLIDFPAQIIATRDNSHRFQGRRMNLLPVLNSNKIASRLVQAARTHRSGEVKQHNQCPTGYRPVMSAWPSLNPTNFQRFGSCVSTATHPVPGTSRQGLHDQPVSHPTTTPLAQLQRRRSGRPAKGKSVQDGHKGKSSNSTPNPRDGPRISQAQQTQEFEAPEARPGDEDASVTYEELWDLELDAFLADQQSNRPVQSEFCFIENNPTSPDFRTTVCVDSGPLSAEEDEMVATGAPTKDVNSPTSTPRPPESSTQWFTTSPHPPNSGPAGLPRGLLPLGGLLCVWSLETGTDTIYKASKSTYVSPMSRTASKVLRLGDTLVDSIGKTLSAYQELGLLPKLVWRCQTLEPVKRL